MSAKIKDAGEHKNVGKDSVAQSGGKIRLKVLTRFAELRLDCAKHRRRKTLINACFKNPICEKCVLLYVPKFDLEKFCRGESLFQFVETIVKFAPFPEISTAKMLPILIFKKRNAFKRISHNSLEICNAHNKKMRLRI